MSHHVIPSTPTISPLHQAQTEVEPSASSGNKLTQQPRLTSRQAKSRSAVGVSADQSISHDTVKQHSVPRTLVRIDQKTVDQILIKGKISLEEISSNKRSTFYKHASMMISGDVSDKSFLLRCLIALYLSVPDEHHPKASRADWLDDQNERWGDDLMFLFEHGSQIDKLNSAGKQYFLEALQEKANVRYRGKGSEDDLSQSLFQAKHRMPVIEDTIA
jgi:hypothetical protein